MPNCPKIIHFIWAGGQFTLPNEGISTISAWSKANPLFTINLWIDVKTAGKSLPELLSSYKEDFAEESIDVLLNPSDARNNPLSASIVLRDIDQAGLRNELVAYEIEQLSPNYGASSDLLRYAILLNKGGAYFDCTDVQPNAGRSLQASDIFKDSNEHFLYVDHLSQNVNPRPEEYANFTASSIGNDTFITTQNNPLMSKINDAAKSKYFLDPTDLTSIVKYAHASHHPKMATISRSGPGLVREVIGKEGENTGFKNIGNRFDKAIGETHVFIYPVRTPQSKLTQPETNTRLWLVSQNNPMPIDLNTGIQKTMSAIEFEVSHFHYLRLEYHAEQLAQSVNIHPDIALTHIISDLNKKDEAFYKKISYVPLIGLCPEAKKFCHQHSKFKLISNLNLEIDSMIMPLKIESNISDIQGGINDMKTILAISNSQQKKEKLDKVKENTKKDWVTKMAYGMRYIKFMIEREEIRGNKNSARFYEQANLIMADYNRFNKQLMEAYPNAPLFKENDIKIKELFLEVNMLKMKASQQPSMGVDPKI